MSHSDLQKVIRGAEVPPGFNQDEAREGREVENGLRDQIRRGIIPEGMKKLDPKGKPIFNSRKVRTLDTQSGEINLSATPDILFTDGDVQLAVEVKKRGDRLNLIFFRQQSVNGFWVAGMLYITRKRINLWKFMILK